MMKDCTVILTCCGGLVIPGMLQSLKSVTERRVRVVGVDMKETAVGAYLVDKFYTVPSGNSPAYINAMLDVATSEEVNVILPTSHEESLALARHRQIFEEKGIKVAVSDYEVLKRAYHKGDCYRFLKDKNLPCPRYYTVGSVEEFREAAGALGFPGHPVVVKPPLNRGGRGVRVLVPYGARESLLTEKPGSLEMNFDIMLEVLQEEGFPELIMMEYLPGEYYSVDLLTKNGLSLYVVPKVRIEGTPSQTLVGEVRRNLEVEKAAADICRAFNFNYNINIEMKYSREGNPIPYDLNPRVAASVAFCTAAGANLLYFAVKLALGEKIPEVDINDGVKMFRYFRELFVADGKPYYL